jgi:formylmethanofuran dehydrogenase subunit E
MRPTSRSAASPLSEELLWEYDCRQCGLHFNLDSGVAYRIVSAESSRDNAKAFAPGEMDVQRQQMEGYKKMANALLFNVQRVHVAVERWEMPGPPYRHEVCQWCGQMVQDGRETRIWEKRFCASIVGGGRGFSNPSG